VLSDLDFTKNNLRIRYRASAEPQELDVDIRTRGIIPIDFAGVALRRIMDIVTFGAAGSSVFAPSVGAAKVLSGPPLAPIGLPSYGPDYHWTLEVAGIAPVTFRTFVEQLRISGGYLVPVESLSLTGSLPLGDTPLSITEQQVKSWLDDPKAYAEEWPAPGFTVLRGDVAEGATLRILLADEITAELSEALKTICLAWVNVTSEYVSESGDLVRVLPDLKDLPLFGLGKRELSARYRAFPRRRAPSRAVIVNMLERFHQTVAKIVEVEVGI
jgi:hypothetical protein